MLSASTPSCMIYINITNRTSIMCVRWGDANSAKFRVTNGVRQGEILSSYLFNVHIDELSEFF